MEKRLLIAIIIVILAMPLAAAIPPTGSIVYGQTGGVVRSTTLPTENVHIAAQQEATVVSMQQLSELTSKIAQFQNDVNSLRTAAESQRTETASQLIAMNRELGAIKASIDGLKVMQQQLSEIKPELEKPKEIIPPMSLTLLSVANAVLLIIVIVLIFWLKAQWKAAEKESHLEEHSMIHLTDFIREAMHKGASLAEIRRRLLQKGWSESKIDDAIQEVRTMHAA
ncbi:MAG: hypothetical protein QXT19_02630 [Candidatus Woesearchaeota archaeon]